MPADAADNFTSGDLIARARRAPSHARPGRRAVPAGRGAGRGL